MCAASAISKCAIKDAHCAAIEAGLAASGLGCFADAFDSEGTLELDERSTRSSRFDVFGARLSILMVLDFAAVHLLSFS